MLLLFILIILKCLFIYLFYRHYCLKFLKYLKIKNQIKPVPNEEFLLLNIKLKNIKKLKLLKKPEIFCLHEDFLRINDKQSIRADIDFIDTFSWVMARNPDIVYTDSYNHELFSFSDSLSRLTTNPYLLHESVSEIRAFEYASDAYFNFFLEKYWFRESSRDLTKNEYNINYIVDEDYFVDPEWNPYLYEYYVEYDKYDGDYHLDTFRNKYSFENYYECFSENMDYEEYASDYIEDDYYEKTYYGYDHGNPENYSEAYNYFYYDDYENNKIQYYNAIFKSEYEYCDYEFYAHDISIYIPEEEERQYLNSLYINSKESREIKVIKNIFISSLIIFSNEYLLLSWRGRSSNEALSFFSYPDHWYKKGVCIYNIDVNTGFIKMLSKIK